MLLGIALIFFSTFSVPALAETAPAITATMSSPTCPGSAHWHMAMLEYFVNAKGLTLPRDEGLARLHNLEIQPFLDGIANASACGVSADIDIWDMGDNIFPVTDSPPRLIQQEFLAKGYDVVMYRYPDQGGLSATYSGAAFEDRGILFPIRPEWAALTYLGVPHKSVIWHEWLHEAVFNIKGRNLEQGLPPDDVHYAASKDPNYNRSTDPMPFYWDFTGGGVLVNGKNLGFTKGDWIRLGTPTHPKNMTGAIDIYSGQWNAGTGILNVRVENPSFSVTLKKSEIGARTLTPAYTYDPTKTYIKFVLPSDSTWNVCVTTKSTGGGAWIGRKVCQDVSFRNITPQVKVRTPSTSKKATSK